MSTWDIAGVAVGFVIASLIWAVVIKIFFATKRPQSLDIAADVTKKLALYRTSGANEMRIRIGRATSDGAALVSFEVTLNGQLRDFDEDPWDSESILKCWIDWPPDKRLGETGQLPLIVQDIQSLTEGVEIADEISGNVTNLRLVPQAGLPPKGVLRFSFVSPNVYTSLRQRHPYTQQRLSAHLNISYGDKLSLIHIERCDEGSLRGRRDNADYYAFALGLENGYDRNTAFFPHRLIEARYTYGNSATALSGPIIPIVYAGLTLLGAGLSLQFVDQELAELGAAAFALGAAPSFVELTRGSRLFSPYAIVSHISWDAVAKGTSAVIRIAALGFTVLALLYYHNWRDPISWLTIVSAIALWTLTAIYLGLLQLGALQGYTCDRCEHPIRNRLRANLDSTSRRLLCKNCARHLGDRLPESWSS
jgi:hypothetical protein